MSMGSGQWATTNSEYSAEIESLIVFLKNTTLHRRLFGGSHICPPGQDPASARQKEPGRQMSITRRKFLRAGTLLALSAAFPLETVLAQQSPKEKDGNPFDQSTDNLSNYNKAAFSSHLNSIFRLYTGYSTVEVALLEVKDMKPAGSAGECFSLVFRGGDKALGQNTYWLEHHSLGTFQLFMTPGGADDNGAQSFVAIINRISYGPALISAPTRSTKSRDTIKPDTPVTSPTTPTPAETKPKPAAPNTPTPAQKTKPTRRIPSWKRPDDFEGMIDQ